MVDVISIKQHNTNYFVGSNVNIYQQKSSGDREESLVGMAGFIGGIEFNTIVAFTIDLIKDFGLSFYKMPTYRIQFINKDGDIWGLSSCRLYAVRDRGNVVKLEGRSESIYNVLSAKKLCKTKY